jgi:hypothetical protein
MLPDVAKHDSWFTTLVDLRERRPGQFIGVTFGRVPRFSMRLSEELRRRLQDPAELERVLYDKRERLADAVVPRQNCSASRMRRS